MGIQAGLVGLPNVGKSTLFNALTKSAVPAENYPFCTIDPHVAITEVPDPRMDKLMALYKSQKQIPATVTFVDIAGLVKGAAAGEGLGNQFLSNIRDVDLILHVLRCFEDENITHSGPINPINDFEVIVAELMLKDVESVTKRIPKVEGEIKKHQSQPLKLKEFQEELNLLKALLTALDAMDYTKARSLVLASKVQTVPLLSTKNFLVIANITENEIENDAYKNNKHYQSLVAHFGADKVIPVSVKIEYELSQLSDEEAKDMMEMVGLKEKSLNTIIRQTYANLGLITFFTCGPKEIHAWPIRKGSTARQAAGEIHSDLERGFICAEIFNCHDLFELGSEAAVKEKGKLRREGQDYIVADGDILNIKFNV
ncbi:MAG TPA: redox-regulated ATPase YchF [Candidatus Babeliales bacterium]|nr:redox-regulated ATPase YchF [Candidatus Babeliales bacterium]